MSKEISQSQSLESIIRGMQIRKDWDSQVSKRQAEDLKNGAGEIYKRCEGLNFNSDGWVELNNDDSLAIFLTREFIPGVKQYSLCITSMDEDGEVKDKFLAELKPDEIVVLGEEVKDYKDKKYYQQIINTLLGMLEENNAK